MSVYQTRVGLSVFLSSLGNYIFCACLPLDAAAVMSRLVPFTGPSLSWCNLPEKRPRDDRINQCQV